MLKIRLGNIITQERETMGGGCGGGLRLLRSRGWPFLRNSRDSRIWTILKKIWTFLQKQIPQQGSAQSKARILETSRNECFSKPKEGQIGIPTYNATFFLHWHKLLSFLRNKQREYIIKISSTSIASSSQLRPTPSFMPRAGSHLLGVNFQFVENFPNYLVASAASLINLETFFRWSQKAGG